MKKAITNELMYEVLKAIQTDVAGLKGDMRDVKTAINSLRTIMGESIKTDALREHDILTLQHRMDRIERRLDLQDRPPPQ